MKRRRFISSIGIALPASVVGGFLFPSCNPAPGDTFDLSDEDVRLLNEIAETIIPADAGSPGAKAAKVGEFMKVYVTDCYTNKDQAIFKEGIQYFKRLCRQKYGKTYPGLTMKQKRELLMQLEKGSAQTVETVKENKKREDADGDAVAAGKTQDMQDKSGTGNKHYYAMIREMTVLGYFTSEPGATRALRYTQTPGYYQGEVLYKQGDKAWAT